MTPGSKGVQTLHHLVLRGSLLLDLARAPFSKHPCMAVSPGHTHGDVRVNLLFLSCWAVHPCEVLWRGCLFRTEGLGLGNSYAHWPCCPHLWPKALPLQACSLSLGHREVRAACPLGPGRAFTPRGGTAARSPRRTGVLRRADSLSYRITTWRTADWRRKRAQAEAPFLKYARAPCTITPRSHAHYREAGGCGPWGPVCGERGAKLGSGPKAGISLTQHGTSLMGPPSPCTTCG